MKHYVLTEEQKNGLEGALKRALYPDVLGDRERSAALHLLATLPTAQAPVVPSSTIRIGQEFKEFSANGPLTTEITDFAGEMSSNLGGYWGASRSDMRLAAGNYLAGWRACEAIHTHLLTLGHQQRSEVPSNETAIGILEVVKSLIVTEFYDLAVERINVGIQSLTLGHREELEGAKQVGWCWVEGQSTDEYTCKFQGYREDEVQWFVDHKWAPMYINATPPPSPSVREAVEALRPFANFYNGKMTSETDNLAYLQYGLRSITVGDFRRAHYVLASLGEVKNG